MTHTAPSDSAVSHAGVDSALEALVDGATPWAQTAVTDRIKLLERVKDGVAQVGAEWVSAAATEKQIPDGSPLVGEEWLSGPYALMVACNGFIRTLSQIDGKRFLDDLSMRTLANGQTALRVTPANQWDRLLLSGVTADVWMKPGVGQRDVYRLAASGYDVAPNEREGKVALVLGAGNIASIAPLDVFQKLLIENQVVLLKMNPVNAYLAQFLEIALAPFIERNALRIIEGDGALGGYAAEHPSVDEIHITGSGATHDAIVWGTGEQGRANKAAGTPKNDRPITSELGAVCPTIVVPGPWDEHDVAFQAENIATQKLHNSGFNCVACQVLIVPETWDEKDNLVAAIESVMGESRRGAYYPGTSERLAAFSDVAGTRAVERGDSPAVLINEVGDETVVEHEVFGPALSIHAISPSDPEQFLVDAIAWANESLHGTLGANIVIHPETLGAIGPDRFDEILTDLHYGAIAVNAWTGVGFLLSSTPWGAFPGHTLDDVQSGIGTVHNTYMLAETERTVVRGPFRPFPRSLSNGEPTLLPKPPWFITNERQHILGELLTDFEYKPGWAQIPRIFANALRG